MLYVFTIIQQFDKIQSFKHFIARKFLRLVAYQIKSTQNERHQNRRQ